MAKRVEQIMVMFRLPATLVKLSKHYAVHHDTDLQVVVAQTLETFLKGGPA